MSVWSRYYAGVGHGIQPEGWTAGLPRSGPQGQIRERTREASMHRPAVIRLALAAALAAAFTAPAPTVIEYQIPRNGAFPHDPAVGADGIVWYTDQATSHIGRFDPATGQFSDFKTPTEQSGPHGIIVAPDGGVWFTANAKGKIGPLDPATD